MTDIVDRLDEHDPVDVEAKAEIVRLRDIVERLRHAPLRVDVELEAADEIARLRADNAQLATGGISRRAVYTVMYDENRQMRAEIERLRTALLFYAERTVESEDGGTRAREALKQSE